MKRIDHQLLLVLGGFLVSLNRGEDWGMVVLGALWFVGMLYKQYIEAE